MKLYGFPPSPNTRKVQAVAVHLGLPLEFEFVDITKGGSRTPQFLALNPAGRTPLLVDGDFKLWESNAIMQYLASRKKNTLWPEDDRVRADIARWQFWQVAHWHEGCGGFLWENLVKKLLLGADNRSCRAEARRRSVSSRCARARRPSRDAAVPRERYPHARRFRGRVLSALRRPGAASARALQEYPGVVFAHRSFARLARNGAEKCD